MSSERRRNASGCPPGRGFGGRARSAQQVCAVLSAAFSIRSPAWIREAPYTIRLFTHAAVRLIRISAIAAGPPDTGGTSRSAGSGCELAHVPRKRHVRCIPAVHLWLGQKLPDFRLVLRTRLRRQRRLKFGFRLQLVALLQQRDPQVVKVCRVSGVVTD